MLDLDHIAITVNNLDESISFYEKIGYKLLKRFTDEEYNWATLRLNNHSIELFEVKNNEPINHIAYSYDTESDIKDLLQRLDYQKELDIFYGDLKRKSFFIEDKSGNSIQFIKK